MDVLKGTRYQHHCPFLPDELTLKTRGHAHRQQALA